MAASKLHDEAYSALSSAFQVLDESNTGFLDREVVRKFGQSFKPEWRQRDTNRLARAMDTDKDSKIGFTDFETFFRQILEQSFKRLDQRRTQTLTHEDVLVISQSFLDVVEQPTPDKTRRCLERLGTEEVGMELFVDYMLTETLAGRTPEEQKRALARLLGISGPQQTQKVLEDSWRDTLMRIQATAKPEFLKQHKLDEHVDQIMKEKTEAQAAAIYGDYIAKHASSAEYMTLFKMVSTQYINEYCSDPLLMNEMVIFRITTVQTCVRRFLAQARARKLQQDLVTSTLQYEQVDKINADSNGSQRFCQGSSSVPNIDRKQCAAKCVIC